VSAQGHRQLLHHQRINDVSRAPPSIDLQPHPSTKTDFTTIHRLQSSWMGCEALCNVITSLGTSIKCIINMIRHPTTIIVAGIALLVIFWRFTFASRMQNCHQHASHGQLNLDVTSSSIGKAGASNSHHRAFNETPDTARKKKRRVETNFTSPSGLPLFPDTILHHGSTHQDHEQARVARASIETTSPHHSAPKTSEVSGVRPTCNASIPSKHFTKTVKSLRSKEPPDKDPRHHNTAFQNAIDSIVANTSSIASRIVIIEPSLRLRTFTVIADEKVHAKKHKISSKMKPLVPQLLSGEFPKTPMTEHLDVESIGTILVTWATAGRFAPNNHSRRVQQSTSIASDSTAIDVSPFTDNLAKSCAPRFNHVTMTIIKSRCHQKFSTRGHHSLDNIREKRKGNHFPRLKVTESHCTWNKQHFTGCTSKCITLRLLKALSTSANSLRFPVGQFTGRPPAHSNTQVFSIISNGETQARAEFSSTDSSTPGTGSSSLLVHRIIMHTHHPPTSAANVEADDSILFTAQR
jgi:hypothetical protein